MISSCISDALSVQDCANKQRLDYFQSQLETIPNTFYALFWLYTHDFLYLSKSMEEVLGHPYEKFIDHGMVFFQNIIPPYLISHIYETMYAQADLVENHPDYIFAKEFLIGKAAVFNSSMEEVPVFYNALFLDVKPFAPTSYLVMCSWIDLRKYDCIEFKNKTGAIKSLMFNVKEIYIKSKPGHFNSLKSRNKISEREKEVALLLMNGYNTKSISDKLQITFNTVESHRKNLLEKLEAKNTPELIHKINNIPI